MNRVCTATLIEYCCLPLMVMIVRQLDVKRQRSRISVGGGFEISTAVRGEVSNHERLSATRSPFDTSGRTGSSFNLEHYTNSTSIDHRPLTLEILRQRDIRRWRQLLGACAWINAG